MSESEVVCIPRFVPLAHSGPRFSSQERDVPVFRFSLLCRFEILGRGLIVLHSKLSSADLKIDSLQTRVKVARLQQPRQALFIFVARHGQILAVLLADSRVLRVEHSSFGNGFTREFGLRTRKIRV